MKWVLSSRIDASSLPTNVSYQSMFQRLSVVCLCSTLWNIHTPFLSRTPACRQCFSARRTVNETRDKEHAEPSAINVQNDRGLLPSSQLHPTNSPFEAAAVDRAPWQSPGWLPSGIEWKASLVRFVNNGVSAQGGSMTLSSSEIDRLLRCCRCRRLDTRNRRKLCPGPMNEPKS